MNKRVILYIIISIVCVISIIIGVYYQIFKKDEVKYNEIPADENTIIIDGDSDINPEDILEEFNQLFDNNFNSQETEVTDVEKIPGLTEQEIVYSAYNVQEEKDGKYSVNINLPVVNVNGNLGTEYNNNTQEIFVNKANEILANSKVYTIYNIEYTAYLNDNILSVVLKSTLKEGDNPQRIIIQSYNFDIRTNQKVTLNDVLDEYDISTDDANDKIEEYIKEANRRSEAVSQALAQTGQKVYKRNINDAMYVTDNVKYFLVGPNGKIYVIYPYGNSEFTSEVDVVKIN